MDIGNRISNLRKSKNITQEKLAEVMGVSRQSISKWESNSSVPDLEKIIKLSEYFETTTDYLLIGKEVTSKNENDTKYIIINDKPKKPKNYPFIMLVIVSIISGLSIFIIWILSKIYSLNDLPYNPQTGKYRIGIDAFTYVHGIKPYYNLSIILLLLGIGAIIIIILRSKKADNK